MLAVGLGLVLLLVAISALVWAFAAGAPNREHLPGYALQSRFVFRVERALALTAGFALLGVFCARLIAGDLPSGITARGVEWKGEDGIAAAINKARGSVENVRKASESNGLAIEELRNELGTLQTTVGEEVATTLGQAQLSIDDIRQLNDAHATVIRIIADELKPLTPLPEQVVQLLEETRELPSAIGQLLERVNKLEQDEPA
jgi:hypothetical protein